METLPLTWSPSAGAAALAKTLSPMETPPWTANCESKISVLPIPTPIPTVPPLRLDRPLTANLRMFVVPIPGMVVSPTAMPLRLLPPVAK